MVLSARPARVRIFALLVLFAACAVRDDETLRAPSPEQALAGLPRAVPLALRLETSEGPIRCELEPLHAPRAVALFVGLARGRTRFRDPRTAAVVRRPFYHDLPFFRAIPDAMVQTGCPLGNGTGQPGFRIPVEASADDRVRLQRPGALLLARYTPLPHRADPHPPAPGDLIGSQLVITLTDMNHLAGRVSVLGSCRDLERVRGISRRVAAKQPVRLLDVYFPPSTGTF